MRRPNAWRCGLSTRNEHPDDVDDTAGRDAVPLDVVIIDDDHDAIDAELDVVQFLDEPEHPAVDLVEFIVVDAEYVAIVEFIVDEPEHVAEHVVERNVQHAVDRFERQRNGVAERCDVEFDVEGQGPVIRPYD